MFGAFGEIERIKKIKDYAFIHFKERDPCVKALEEWNGKELEGVAIDCSLAKPQGDSKKKKPFPGQFTRGRGAGFGNGFGGGFQGGRGRANNMYPNQLVFNKFGWKMYYLRGYEEPYYGGGYNDPYSGYGGYDQGYGGGYGGYGGGDYGYGGGYGAPRGGGPGFRVNCLFYCN